MAKNGITRDGSAALPILYGNAFDAAQLQGFRLRRSCYRIFPGAPGPTGRANQRLRDDKRQPLAQTNISQDVEPALGGVFPPERFPALPGDRFRWHFQRRQCLLSALLDNAPTYLVFFGLAGGDAGELMTTLSGTLAAISMGAVYMGALTYVGNAPNLMIYAIAVERGVKMPSFFGYLAWVAALLLPVLALVTFVFLVGA